MLNPFWAAHAGPYPINDNNYVSKLSVIFEQISDTFKSQNEDYFTN